ncbi:MAG: hypothetical protein HC919_00415 [Oscillatoriales cyanobacterium SM2_2_1]|nr:hypothetical protein [Oscillatoriales cyanobacterium SM2_2_1]
MAIIPLKAWYVPHYEPLRSLVQRPHDLRLAKNSLLKSALRADFLDESAAVQDSEWFQRYLAGEVVEFYVEGSGSYAIANIDLISHEIYFTKIEMLSSLEPTIYFSHQVQRPETSQTIHQALIEATSQLNSQSRLPLTLVLAPRSTTEPLKLRSSAMTHLRKCLLFVADVSTVGNLLSPQVCVEVGYALYCKRAEQVLLIDPTADAGEGFPFDVPPSQRLWSRSPQELHRQLPEAIARCLERFHLFHSQR